MPEEIKDDQTSEKRLEELNSEEDKSLPKNDENTPTEVTPPVEATPPGVEEPAVDWEARALKAEDTAENYKKEIEVKGLRSKERVKEIVAPPQEVDPNQLSNEQVVEIQNNFVSKREDVLHEFREEINQLETADWERVKNLLKGATLSVYEQALSEKRYVASGEISDSIRNIIDFAKGKSQGVEEARVQGFNEAQKVEQAEIGGVKSIRKQPSKIQVSEEDQRVSQDSGIAPERVAEIRDRKDKVTSNWEELYK